MWVAPAPPPAATQAWVGSLAGQSTEPALGQATAKTKMGYEASGRLMAQPLGALAFLLGLAGTSAACGRRLDSPQREGAEPPAGGWPSPVLPLLGPSDSCHWGITSSYAVSLKHFSCDTVEESYCLRQHFHSGFLPFLNVNIYSLWHSVWNVLIICTIFFSKYLSTSWILGFAQVK